MFFQFHIGQCKGKEVLEAVAANKPSASDLGIVNRVACTCYATKCLIQQVQVLASLPELCTCKVGRPANSELQQRVKLIKGVDHPIRQEGREAVEFLGT